MFSFEYLRELIRKRRWSYLGHILRRQNLPLTKELQSAFSGKKQRERPRINISTLTKYKMKEMGLTSLDEAKKELKTEKNGKIKR